MSSFPVCKNKCFFLSSSFFFSFSFVFFFFFHASQVEATGLNVNCVLKSPPGPFSKFTERLLIDIYFSSR